MGLAGRRDYEIWTWKAGDTTPTQLATTLLELTRSLGRPNRLVGPGGIDGGWDGEIFTASPTLPMAA